ncbi:beta-lactamase family protein [Candidatus Roizmanbacteria bacterium]|nr:beta-lactamase family protein [Candidatus Roizmanbacteria bacterium]
MNKQNLNNKPGYALYILHKGCLAYEKYIGYADMEKNMLIDKRTNFRLASITKLFTAQAIEILERQNVITYKTKLVDIFPQISMYLKPVTIYSLLTHTSGIPDHEKNLYTLLEKTEPTLYDAWRVLQTKKKLLFPCGSKFQYSDAGYVVLALIIEHITRKKYSTYVSENIFQPFQMNTTMVLDETKPTIPFRALGYSYSKRSYKIYDYNPLNYIVGDEGIYSNIEDLIKWLSAFSKNDRNFGWFQEDKNILWCSGSWVGFRNTIMLDTKKETIAIFLSNSTKFSSIMMRKKFIERLL